MNSCSLDFRQSWFDIISISYNVQFSFSHVFTEANKMADALARNGSNCTGFEVYANYVFT